MLSVEPRLGLTSNTSFRFSPDLGAWRIELTRLARTLASTDDEVLTELDKQVEAALLQADNPDQGAPSIHRLRFAFALSLLRDILSVGGRVQVADSEIYVSWPDWDAPGGREAVGRALNSITNSTADTRCVGRNGVTALDPMFAPAMTPENVLRFLSCGRFWLARVDEVHSLTGKDYNDAFWLALRVWNMPYRGRQGRRRRFVVVGEHPEIHPTPVVVGLIEIGDDAPFNSERDRLLGLRMPEFQAWLLGQPDSVKACLELADRLRLFRSAILPIQGLDALLSTEAILDQEEELLRRAFGRSRTDADFTTKKRIAYLIRLVRGETALRRIARGKKLSEEKSSLREGIRAIRDLTVPRIHMEATVCGAVPPFAQGLAGKLVVSFLAHPDILEITRGEPGSIVQDLLDVREVGPLIPDWGILAITTKGLYPGHSALYNRSSVPGKEGAVHLRKIGETKGATTMFFTQRTARLAQLVLRKQETRQISLTYGTGGSKRQRLIEAAVRSAALPGELVHAGIHRPVYGVRLADNIEDVIWLGDTPHWLVHQGANPCDYSEQAVKLWRSRWMRTAQRRLGENADLVPGVFEVLSLVRKAGGK